MAMYLGNIPIVTVNDLPYMHTEIVEAFTSRQTANGLNILDPSPAVVEMIKGKTVKSANLACNEYATVTDGENGILFKRIKGVSYFQIYGTPTAAGGRTVLKVTIAKAGRYTLSIPNLPILRLELLRNGTTFATISKGTQKYASFNITEDNTIFSISAVANTTDTLGTESNPTTIELMLTGGEVGYIEYTPYFSGLKHANFKGIKSTGKNILKVKDYEGTHAGVAIKVKDNKFTAIGTAIGNGVELWLPLKNAIPKGTYTSNIDGFVGSNVNSLSLSPANRDFTNRISIATRNAGSLTKTITFISNYLAIYIAGGNVVDCSFDLMLNFGETAQPFEPYTEEEYGNGNSYELAEYDYINPQTGEYSKNTETITITGSSFSSGVVIGTGSITKTVNLSKYSKMYPYNQKQSCVISNGFITHNNYFSYKPDEGVVSIKTPQIAFHTQGGYLRVYLPISIASTEEEFIEYFNNNPLTISYELKTPTVEKIDLPNNYTAKNGGSETVEQGDVDNSQWGAIPITTINYREKLDGNTFFTVPIIKRYGKNLIPFPYSGVKNGDTKCGITFNIDDNGVITANGTVTGEFTLVLIDMNVKAGDVYSFSSNNTNISSTTFRFTLFNYDSNNSVVNYSHENWGNRVEIGDTVVRIRGGINFKAGVTVNNEVFKPMLNDGDTLLPYELYKEPWYEY